MARTHFDTPPAEYDALRSGHLGRHRIQIFDEVIDRLDHHGESVVTIVEIGSATGFTLEVLASRHPGCRFIGVEIEPELARYARETHGRSNIEFVEERVEAFTLDVPADVVISADVIHHIHDHPAAFAAVRRLLRPGGRWVVVEPNIWQGYVTLTQERMKRSGYDEDHFRPWKLEPLLLAAGFSIDLRRYAHLLPAARSAPTGFEVKVERALERFRLLGGSVVYELTAT